MTIPQQELASAVPGLLRYARTLTRDPDRADDLVQETLTRALERQDSFRARSSVRTWLHRIMHNLSVDQGRRQREVAAGDLLAEDQVAAVERAWSNSEYTVDAATVVERAETRSELEDALARLPVIYRSAVLLHDGEGLTSREVADVQQIGLPAAKQRLRRGRMMLVTALARGAERRELLKGVPMRCWDARAMVSDYLDDELAQPDRERLERHLQACPTCPPLYSGLVGACAAVGAWRDPDTVIPAHILERLSAFAE